MTFNFFLQQMQINLGLVFALQLQYNIHFFTNVRIVIIIKSMSYDYSFFVSYKKSKMGFHLVLHLPMSFLKSVLSSDPAPSTLTITVPLQVSLNPTNIDVQKSNCCYHIKTMKHAIFPNFCLFFVKNTSGLNCILTF